MKLRDALSIVVELADSARLIPMEDPPDSNMELHEQTLKQERAMDTVAAFLADIS